MGLVIILLILAGMFKGIMDMLLFHFDMIHVPFVIKHKHYWDPTISWENKYKIIREPRFCDKKIVKLLLKFGRWLFINPLVFITDGWHLVQFLFITSICLALSLAVPMYPWYLNFIIFRIIFGIGFISTYKNR